MYLLIAGDANFSDSWATRCRFELRKARGAEKSVKIVIIEVMEIKLLCGHRKVSMFQES